MSSTLPRRRLFPRLLRVFLWTMVALAVVVCAAALVVDSPAFEERIRVIVERAASEALGREVTIGGMDLEPLSLGVELTDVELAGPTPDSEPVARLPRAGGNVRVERRWPLELAISRVWLERPHLRLEIDENGGTNLPSIASGEGESSVRVVDLGTVSLTDGVLEVNEATLPLEVQLDALRILAEGEGWLTLEGRLGSEAEVALIGAPPQPFDVRLEVGVEVEAEVARVVSGTISGDGLDLAIEGTVRWDQPEPSGLLLTVDAAGQAEAALRLVGVDAPVAGRFEARSELVANAAVWGVQGSLSSPSMTLAGQGLSALESTFSVSSNEARVLIDRGRWAGGEIDGTVVVDLARPGQPTEVSLAISGADAARAAGGVGVDWDQFGGELEGRIDGELTYSFLSTAPYSGDGWADLRLRARANRQVAGLRGRAAVTIRDGVVESQAVRVELEGDRIESSALRYDLATGEGIASVQVESDDLDRLLGRVLDGYDERPEWWPREGSARLDGEVQLSGGAVEVDAVAQLNEVSAPWYVADSVTASARLDAEKLVLDRFELVQGEGALLAAVEVPLDTPDAFTVSADIASLPAEALLRWLPDAPEVTGPLSGRLELEGKTTGIGGRFEGSIVPARLAGLELAGLEAALEIDPDRIFIRRGEINTEAGVLVATGEVGLGAEGRLALELEAPTVNVGASPVAELHEGRLSGAASVKATVGGTIERPSVNGRIAGADWVLAGRAMGPVVADLSFDGRELALTGELGRALSISGGGTLELAADGQDTDLSFALSSDSLAALGELAVGELPPGWNGRFAGALELRGRPEELASELSLSLLEVEVEGRSLRNLEPVMAQLRGDAIEIQSLWMGEADDQVFVFGRIPLDKEPLDLKVSAEADSAWFDRFVPGIAMQGRVSALIAVGGPLATPTFDGQASVSSGTVIADGFPHAFDEVEAVFLLYPGRLVVDHLDGELAGGTLRTAGRLDLTLDGGLTDYRLQAEAQNLRLRYPEGWFLVGDAVLELSPEAGRRTLSGEVTLERAHYLRDVEVGAVQLLTGFLRRQRLSVGEADEELAKTALNVAVEIPGGLRIANNLADLTGGADFAVRGNLARPTLVGAVELDRGGTLVWADQEYEVERGLLTFASQDRINPILDLEAHTRLREYDIVLNLSGTAARLNADVSSDPPLPNLDVLALLSSGGIGEREPGRSSGTAGGGDRISAASRFLYGQAASAVSGRVKDLLGFDRLTIDPGAGSGDRVDSARITIGKQISRRLYVTYSRNPSDNTDELVRAEYELDEGLVLVVSFTDGKAWAGDLRWDRRF